MRYTGAGLTGAGIAVGVPWLVRSNGPAVAQKPGQEQEPLDPTTIPKFAHELPIPRVFAPSVIRDASGNVVRHGYTVSENLIRAQVLPPGFPETTLLAFGGRVSIPGSVRTEEVYTFPGPVFENTRGIPSRVRWRNLVTDRHFLPVDPAIHLANPNAFEPPVAPFTPFPPGYDEVQSPVPMVVHTHGLVVRPELDGTADEWFTNLGHEGPSFVTNVYEMPNEQPSTQLFYHDHVMGMTRINIYAGLVGHAYFIRDPNSPLDQPDSPLPSGPFEIPLAIASRSFFTDGELDFPRVGANPFHPYMEAEDFSQTMVVNGKAWPNLNVQRRQYRFRLLATANMRVFEFFFDLNGTTFPFTVIGADGGYLPAPLEVESVTMGITERTDILVDFSQFEPGTQVIMRNALIAEPGDEGGGDDPESAGQIMRFTVVDSEPVPPPALDPGLFPARAELVTDAPTRTKALVRFRDSEEHVTETDRTRTLDGLGFTTPVTELPLIGSTEQWDLINTNEAEDDDPDFGNHQIHIHLLEFQVLNRQEFDVPRFLQDWFLFNGHQPMTRPIVLDTSDYLIGDLIPPEPNETGWKDTARAFPQQVTRLVVRWAPQEVPTGGVEPGQNLFPVDVEFPSDVDPVAGPGYVWHCHMINHEDHEMMRPLAVVSAWQAGVEYPAGKVVAHENVDYRARVEHTAADSEPPTARFDLWERVNNNDGSWQPQIIYAVQDRVLHEGQLFEALHVHQAEPGQFPQDDPDRWQPLPMTAKGQLVEFCDPDDPETAEFFEIGQNGTEDEAREVLQAALAVCRHVHRMPSSGITEVAIVFDLPDGSEFRPEPTDGTAFYETMSKLSSITVSTLRSGQRVTVNGRALRRGRNYPLPPQRNMGYLIETTGRATFVAR